VRADTVIRRHYVSIGAGQIHYREAGDKSLPILLLLHQSPSSSAMYEPLMALLAQDFHLLAPDTPGFGGSSFPKSEAVTTADYAAAIHGFLQALAVGSCKVFGHHTGAAIAVQLEHDFPGTASAMALSGPPLLDDQQKLSLPAMASPIELKRDGSHLSLMWQRISAKDPDAPVELLQREVNSALACGSSYQASYRAVAAQAFGQQLAKISAPVLVFAGDLDPLYGSVEPSLALLQRGERATLPGGERTYVCERQAGAVAGLLRDFFHRHHSAEGGT
jgi:pimeloyl-ACP methyl ester carboxylesterase